MQTFLHAADFCTITFHFIIARLAYLKRWHCEFFFFVRHHSEKTEFYKYNSTLSVKNNLDLNISSVVLSRLNCFWRESTREESFSFWNMCHVDKDWWSLYTTLATIEDISFLQAGMLLKWVSVAYPENLVSLLQPFPGCRTVLQNTCHKNPHIVPSC